MFELVCMDIYMQKKVLPSGFLSYGRVNLEKYS
jgi:hypothetical protein